MRADCQLKFDEEQATLPSAWGLPAHGRGASTPSARSLGWSHRQGGIDDISAYSGMEIGFLSIAMARRFSSLHLDTHTDSAPSRSGVRARDFATFMMQWAEATVRAGRRRLQTQQIFRGE